jgi:hypothetical protein
MVMCPAERPYPLLYSAQELALFIVRNGEGLSQGRLLLRPSWRCVLSTVPNVPTAAMT